MTKNIRYYATGHTAKGFVNYLSSNLKEIHQIITLKHSSNRIKTAILKRLLQYFQAKFDLEIILSPSGKEYIEAVLVPDLSLGIITDVIANEKIDSQILNIEKYLAIPKPSKGEQESVSRDYKRSYSHFSKALKIHDELEALYINEMDFKKADQLAEEFLTDSLGTLQARGKSSSKKYRLFGTNTPEGQVNIVPELLDRVKTRYYLKGRAGTGKSTFMRAVMKRSEELGLDMEIYLCSFDPNSVDMVLLPEADFCIFDSTAPHEFFPEREKDFIIDLYEETVKEGTDEKFASEIKRISKEYKAEIHKAMKYLKEAGKKQLNIEKEQVLSEANLGKITKNILEIVRKH